MSSEEKEIIKIMNYNNLSSFKVNFIGKIQFFVSEMGFIFIIAICILLTSIIPKYHPKKTFTSKNISDFEFNQDPIILMHLTDIHMSENKKQRIDGSSIFLVSLCEYNPDVFVLTGDYVDNVKKGQELGEQNLEEWKMYNTSIRSVILKKRFKVVDISGNHDQ